MCFSWCRHLDDNVMHNCFTIFTLVLMTRQIFSIYRRGYLPLFAIPLHQKPPEWWREVLYHKWRKNKKNQTVNFLFFSWVYIKISKYDYVYFSNQLHTRKYEHWKMRFIQGLITKTKFNLQYNFNASINRSNEHFCQN